MNEFNFEFGNEGDNENKDPIEGLEIKIHTTAQNNTLLSVIANKKHYKAFANEQKGETPDGRTYQIKVAVLKLCDYSACKQCDGHGNYK
jgi:hypothetical protein